MPRQTRRSAGAQFREGKRQPELLQIGQNLVSNLQQFTAAHHGLNSLDVGPNLAVDLEEGDLLTHVLVEGLVQRSDALAVGVELATDVDGLAGSQQLVSEDGQGVLDNPAGLAGGGGAHGDDILLVGGGGDGVHEAG